MSVFDEDINLKNLETIALFKQIRAIVDWIIDNLSQYRETVLCDLSPLSILRKNGYDTDIIPNEILRTSDMWERFVGTGITRYHETPNYTTELITMDHINIGNPLDSTYKKLNFIFSRVEIVIINGEPYIKCGGNNIIHMRYYKPIPDFIKFVGNPYVVITSKIEEDRILEYRRDCEFIIYDKNYTLDNVAEEPYDIRINNDSYGTIQSAYSKAISWNLIPIQV